MLYHREIEIAKLAHEAQIRFDSLLLELVFKQAYLYFLDFCVLAWERCLREQALLSLL